MFNGYSSYKITKINVKLKKKNEVFSIYLPSICWLN